MPNDASMVHADSLKTIFLTYLVVLVIFGIWALSAWFMTFLVYHTLLVFFPTYVEAIVFGAGTLYGMLVLYMWTEVTAGWPLKHPVIEHIRKAGMQ